MSRLTRSKRLLIARQLERIEWRLCAIELKLEGTEDEYDGAEENAGLWISGARMDLQSAKASLEAVGLEIEDLERDLRSKKSRFALLDTLIEDDRLVEAFTSDGESPGEGEEE